MSEPDSTPRRRPPTIDLTATEVDAEKPAAAQEPSQEPAKEPATAKAPSDGGQQTGEPAPGRPRSPIKSAVAGIVGGATGAIAVIAIGAGLWFGGYVPPGLVPASPSPQPTDNPAIADISARLNKIEGAIATQQQKPVPAPQPDPALVSRLAAAEAATKSLSDSLAALTHRIDDAAAAAQNALAQAKSASTAADAAKSTAQTVTRSDLDALAARIAPLESTVKTLADDIKHETATADDRAARLTVAAEALRATVERGAPYQAELAAAKSLGADQSATAPLEAFAAAGVPGAKALAHELASLVPALQQAAEPAASNSSFLGRLENNARRLVVITPVDAPPGDDPASVVTRIDVDAAHADIAAALADIAKLPDAAKPLAAAWAEKAQARDAAIAASRKLSADALAALSKPNPQ